MHLSRTRKSLAVIVFSLVCLLPALQAQAAQNSPKPIHAFISQVQTTYDGITTFSASFEQIVKSNVGQRKATGTVYLKKPGKMRFEYEKPQKKLFVADGNTLWMDEPEEEEDRKILKKSLKSSELPSQVRFLFGEGKLTDDFHISYHSDPAVLHPGLVMVKLLPKKSGENYKYIVFGIDPTNFLVKETYLYDIQGGYNQLVFSKIETNKIGGPDEKLFQFTPPKGVKVIEQ